ncbi:hypothetical protein [Streptomyces lydicus]|uniref:hypothetical protein n=1 Tax=Streptomyces lydicus TaxID=47763 RepID=UPI00379EFFDE
MPVACPAGTRGLEARLRRDGGHCALLTSYTHDSEPMQTTVMLRALDERAPLPFRVPLEEVDTETWTHTLSEGAFATFGATTQWWEAHWRDDGVPLPTAAPAARHATALVAPAPGARPAPPRGPSR